MLHRRPALDEMSRSSTIEERSRELPYRVKCLCLLTSGVTSKQAADRTVVRGWSILLALSERSLFFGVHLKGDLSRALVD